MAAVQLSSFLPESSAAQATSSADLQECADHIGQRIQQARQTLLQHLHHHLANPEGNASLKVALDSLCEAPYLTPASPEASLAEFAWQYRQVVEQISVAEAQHSKVKAAAEFERQLAEFDSCLNAGQYLDAAYVTVALRRALQAAEDSEEGPSLSPQLRNSCSECEPRLASVLDAAITQSVVLGASTHTLTIVPPAGVTGGLLEVWSALNVLGVLAPRLESLTDKLLEGVVNPLMTSSSCRVQVARGPPATLHWECQPSPLPSGGAPGVHIEGALQQVLTFLAEQLFNTSDDIIPKFGDVFWGRLVSSYKTARVEPLLQDLQCELEGADRITEAAAQLEEFASCLGFVAEEGALTAVVGNCMKAVQHSRQQPLLVEARQLLMEPSQQLVTVGQPLHPDKELMQRCCQGELQEWEVADAPCGWDMTQSILPCGRYQVTQVAVQLLELLERCVAQAAASTSVLAAQALCSAASHISQLAQTLPLLGARGRQISSIPQMSLLYHNDLQHLASGLLLCTVQHAPALRSALGDATPTLLLAAARQLQDSAKSVLAQQVGAQQQHLGELLTQMDSFQLASSGSTAAAQRKALSQVLYNLSRLGRLLMETLAPATMVDVSNQVLGYLCSSIAGLIISRGDIGADESQELSAMLQSLSNDMLQQLLSGSKQQAVLPDSSGLTIEQVHQVIFSSCQPLRKLRLLAKILDSKLSLITEMWEQRALQKAGFHKAEVVALVQALFEKTDFRDECLQLIFSIN